MCCLRYKLVFFRLVFVLVRPKTQRFPSPETSDLHFFHPLRLLNASHYEILSVSTMNAFSNITRIRQSASSTNRPWTVLENYKIIFLFTITQWYLINDSFADFIDFRPVLQTNILRLRPPAPRFCTHFSGAKSTTSTYNILQGTRYYLECSYIVNTMWLYRNTAYSITL